VYLPNKTDTIDGVTASMKIDTARRAERQEFGWATRRPVVRALIRAGDWHVTVRLYVR
jgi:hypothetical protein